MKVLSVVETAIYVDDLDAAEEFYQRVLGLNVIGRVQNRYVFFQVGESDVLLAFNPATTLTGDTPHGATGPGHFALGIEMQSLDDWRRRLRFSVESSLLRRRSCGLWRHLASSKAEETRKPTPHLR